MGPYKIKTSYTAKKNNWVKRQLTEWEKMQFKKMELLNQKESSQKKNYKCLSSTLKICSTFLVIVEMQNDYFESPCHPNQNDNHWEIKTTNVGKKKLLLTVGGNVNWYCLHGKQCEATQQARNKITMWTRYTTTKGLYILLLKYMIIHVYCCTIHNI